MRDPHVVSLRYRFNYLADESFADPPALDGDESAFSYLLSEDILQAEMKDHFPSTVEARGVVEPFLRTWEVGHALDAGRKRIWFVFEDAVVVDRNPRKPGEPHVIEIEGGIFTISGSSASLHVTRTKYPEPPTGIVASPAVETMWFRFQQFKEAKEPLLSMAYFCLSFLERTTGCEKGARAAVCKMYSIDTTVREKFGDLVSEYGKPEEARKYSATHTETPLREVERKWIEQVTLALIRRKAEFDFNPSATLKLISMEDFVRI
jgi:hypothetical protein